MPFTDPEYPIEELADLYDGMAHPVRVSVMRVLREKGRLSMSDLRKAVAARYRDVETRTLQFHVHKMHLAGIVDVGRVDGREVVTLLRDVSIRVRPAAPASQLL